MNADVAKLKEITVLYCEDEEYLRDITMGILKSFTKKQFVGFDGAEGLKLFQEHKDEIDLVITDVSMPNMNGLEMAKVIKEMNPNMPVIVATAFSNSEYLLEAIDLGVDKYVLKPINMKKLLDTMSKSLLYHELRDLYLDSLTKLQNRNGFLKASQKMVNPLMAVINIDKFSVLNDLYGEENGDLILLVFSNKIHKIFTKDKYTIFRVGADRFAILCNDLSIEIDPFLATCQEFLSLIEKNGVDINESNTDLSITIGVAQSTDKHTYEYAQRAVKKARKSFINILVYNTKEFDNKAVVEENMKWIKKLKTGVEDGRFQAYFQPIVDAQTQKVYKYEALIRYIDEDGTEVSPFHFLDIAKKAKLFPVIMKVMLGSVVKIIKEKQVRVAVNLSFDDMINKETSDYIFKILEEHKEESKLLDFEILESEEIEDFSIVRDFIAKLRTYGCQIGVDDFGAGYSNFNMLEELNVDFVKIDGSLIKEIHTIPKYALIVETIAQFCKKLDIKTVAEFICSEDVYEKTKSLEIDYMQGYHFGKPESKDSIK